jgi:hypothetical protein
LKNYENNSKALFNGLQKYSCEATLFTPNGLSFFIGSPQFSREEEYNYWDLGFLDIRSCLFYEMGLLVKTPFPKNSFFGEWLFFLQILIDKKIYTNLFEILQFNKGILSHNDRLVYEAAFIRAIKQIYLEILNADGGNENNQANISTLISVDFLIYLCDLMKNHLKMVSFSLLKKKISSNLKNFKFQI